MRIDILGLGALFQVGRQVVTDFGKRIDLLAIDGQGDLYVIELKKDRTPREVVAQALEYGFWVQNLSFEAVRDLYAHHHEGEDFDSGFTSHFEADLPEAINTAHHLVVVATGMDARTEQIVEYVRGYGVPINVIFFEYLTDDDREYLARSWLADPELEPSSAMSGKKQAPWNGLRFLRRGRRERRSKLGRHAPLRLHLRRTWREVPQRHEQHRVGASSAGRG